MAFECALAGDSGTDLSYKARFVAEGRELRAGLFERAVPLTTFGRDRARLEGEARGRAGPVQLLLTATESGREGTRPETRLLVNEAYVDFGAGAHHFTVGKKILSADVGYGFRPIDVLQRETRLQVLPPALEGIPNVSWERFTTESAWSLTLANPGHGKRGEPSEDGSVALRYYGRRGGADLHAVARLSERHRLEAGGAVSLVPHESLELHGSFLVQERGERQTVQGPTPLDAPRRALGGLTYTRESGWSLIGELWWDGSAPTATDWQNLALRARRLQAFPAALAGMAQVFQAPAYSRRSGFVRLAWTDPAGGGWSASLDLLRTLEDRGWSATAALAWEADRLRVDAGLRRFGGSPESAYGLLPERGTLFIGASLAL
jgi:hypothetical protein